MFDKNVYYCSNVDSTMQCDVNENTVALSSPKLCYIFFQTAIFTLSSMKDVLLIFSTFVFLVQVITCGFGSVCCDLWQHNLPTNPARLWFTRKDKMVTSELGLSSTEHSILLFLLSLLPSKGMR